MTKAEEPLYDRTSGKIVLGISWYSTVVAANLFQLVFYYTAQKALTYHDGLMAE